MPTITNITPINSTTFVDMLGVLSGLSRLPGESSASFLDRVLIINSNKKDHSYAATLERIATKLGLSVYVGITISSTTPIIVLCSIAGVLIMDPSKNILVNSPLLEVASDGVWVWRRLSDLVNDINQVTGISATLVNGDSLALCVSKQTNYFWATESFVGTSWVLQKTNPQLDTLSFNNQVPTYTVVGSTLRFVSEVPSNTTLTYAYIDTPFDIVASDIGMFSLTDPNFSSVAAPNGSTLTQQTKEILQYIMSVDRSYWGK